MFVLSQKYNSGCRKANRVDKNYNHKKMKKIEIPQLSRNESSKLFGGFVPVPEPNVDSDSFYNGNCSDTSGSLNGNCGCGACETEKNQ